MGIVEGTYSKGFLNNPQIWWNNCALTIKSITIEIRWEMMDEKHLSQIVAGDKAYEGEL